MKVKKKNLQKNVSLNENLNFKNCLQASQLKNKIKRLAKNKTDVKCFIENHKHFIIKNRSILKPQQEFKSERHNDFTEEINKITLSSTDDKRIQSTDSVQTCPYGTKKI